MEIAPALSVAKASAPVSSCKIEELASETVIVTLAQSSASIVPRLQARFWPLWSGCCEALTSVTPGARVSVNNTPVSGSADSL